MTDSSRDLSPLRFHWKAGLAKKDGNTCISQDGGKHWYLYKEIHVLGNTVQLHTSTLY